MLVAKPKALFTYTHLFVSKIPGFWSMSPKGRKHPRLLNPEGTIGLPDRRSSEFTFTCTSVSKLLVPLLKLPLTYSWPPLDRCWSPPASTSQVFHRGNCSSVDLESPRTRIQTLGQCTRPLPSHSGQAQDHTT